MTSVASASPSISHLESWLGVGVRTAQSASAVDLKTREQAQTCWALSMSHECSKSKQHTTVSVTTLLVFWICYLNLKKKTRKTVGLEKLRKVKPLLVNLRVKENGGVESNRLSLWLVDVERSHKALPLSSIEFDSSAGSRVPRYRGISFHTFQYSTASFSQKRIAV